MSREIEQTIEQADGSAYMSIFVTTSTSYTPPEKYLNDAKIEILRCAKSMDELSKMKQGFNLNIGNNNHSSASHSTPLVC